MADRVTMQRSSKASQWQKTTLDKVTNLILSSVDKKSKQDEHPVKLCVYTDVYYNHFIKADMKFRVATATDREISKFSLYMGDVIITKLSEYYDDIGVPALIREEIPNLVCAYHLAILRPVFNKIIGMYLFYALNTLETQQQFHARANGVTRFTLRKKDIQDIEIPLASLSEQRGII